MKPGPILFSMLTLVCTGRTPQPNPVHFRWEAKKLSNQVYEVHITAILDSGWHIYARVQPKSAISTPTEIAFISNPLLILKGEPKEIGKMEKQKLPDVGIEQNMYEKTVDFVQTVNLKAAVKTAVNGTITYQACTDERCLPAKTTSFTVPIN